MRAGLLPGHQAPDFELYDMLTRQATRLSQLETGYSVLLCWDARKNAAALDTVQGYLLRQEEFTTRQASLVAVAALDADLERAYTAGVTGGVYFANREAVPQVAASLHIYGPAGAIQPSVYVLGPGRLVRKVYPPGQYAGLPNPAMVLRALNNLAQAPLPPPADASDWHKGILSAPVSVIEYADYQCGPCRETYRSLKATLPQFSERVVWVHRHLPLRHSHPLAQQAAEAAEAAGAQGRFWEMHDALFESDGALEMGDLLAYAEGIGLDMLRFRRELEEHTYRKKINGDLRDAIKAGAKLPPVVFINRILYDGARTPQAFAERIGGLLGEDN